MFSIYDGRKHFYQWDTDRKLIINDKSISEVHFANCLCPEARKCIPYALGDLLVVDVPNQLLTEYQDIRVWGYDSGMTKHCAVFEVEKRTKPADYVYTPEELKTWEELEARIDAMGDASELTARVDSLEEYVSAMIEGIAYLNERITALETGAEIIYFNVNDKAHHTLDGTTWNGYVESGHNLYDFPCDYCGGTDIQVHYDTDLEGYFVIGTYCPECRSRRIYRVVSVIEGELVKPDEVIRAEEYETFLIKEG